MRIDDSKNICFVWVLLSMTGVNALRCNRCQDAIDIDQCVQVEQCDSDEQCYYNQVPSKLTSGLVWEMSCMRQLQCAALIRFLGLNPVYRKIGCCEDKDLCNRYYARSTTSNGHVTTTSSPQTTTHQPKIVINAPGQAVYQSMVQLSCVTIPPAEKYSWTFNGTSTLPSSVTTVQYTPGKDELAGTDVLTILRIDLTSFGTYTCTGVVNGNTVTSSHFIGIMSETIPLRLIG